MRFLFPVIKYRIVDSNNEKLSVNFNSLSEEEGGCVELHLGLDCNSFFFKPIF